MAMSIDRARLWYARRFKSSGGALRVYAVGFCITLVTVAVAFAVLAATSEPDQRGGFIGLAIVWFAMAGGAVAVVVAVERRVRRSQQGPRPDRSSKTSQ